MKSRNIKITVCLVFVILCLFSGCNKKTDDSENPGTTPAVSQSPSQPDESLPVIPELTIDEAVSEDVKQSIDFDAYDKQDAYDLNEFETDTSAKIKLIYPVNTFMTDTMDVKYHVALGEKDNGAVVLEVLGTDFNIQKNVSVIKVEWKSVGLKVLPTEKAYEFKGLCITLDDEVYFYEDVFYSPFVEGREISYNAISN